MIEFMRNKNPFSVLFALFVIIMVFLVNTFMGLRRRKIETRDNIPSFSDEEIYKLFNLSVPHK
jgi:hypothetical protein